MITKIRIPGRGLVEITIIGMDACYCNCEEDNKMQHIVHKDDIYTPAQGRELKTLQEFYDFYFAIPDELWCTGEFVKGNACCALGLIGERNDQSKWTKNTHLLAELLGVAIEDIMFVNDDLDNDFPQPTPKERILALIKSRMN